MIDLTTWQIFSQNVTLPLLQHYDGLRLRCDDGLSNRLPPAKTAHPRSKDNPLGEEVNDPSTTLSSVRINHATDVSI